MITKKKKRTYYETELIDSVVCDKCGKELTKIDEDIIVINVDNVYFNNKKSRLEDLKIGYTRHYCDECSKQIQELLLFKD